MKKPNKIWIFAPLVFFLSMPVMADLVVIAHKDLKERPTEKKVYNLYSGIEKNSSIELLNQGEGQAARSEFFEKFLKHSEIEMKQRWSALVFSGNRTPTSLTDDRSVIEYIKAHANAVGYVDEKFLQKNPLKDAPLVTLFTIP